MSDEPLLALQQAHADLSAGPGVERETPSPEEQQTADAVFTDDQAHLVAALMAMQTGAGLVHLIADNARVVEEPKRRKNDQK